MSGHGTSHDDVVRAEPTVRVLAADELDPAARIHTRAFPDSLLGILGAETVHDYYLEILESGPDAVVLGAFVGDELAGFAVCNPADTVLGRYLVTHAPVVAWRALRNLPALARQVTRSKVTAAGRVLVQLLRGVGDRLRRRRDRPAADAPPQAPRPFKVLSIAVDPRWQRRGVGRALIVFATDLATERGFDRARLSVSSTNLAARRFYEQLGWEAVDVDGSEIKLEIALAS